MVKTIILTKQVVDSLLTYSKEAYPEEGILLLRGKVKKEVVEVESVVIPPFATHAESFSSFPIHMLPLDLSILGIAHSHPSGVLEPSDEDLINFYGIMAVIMGYPYNSERDVAIFNSEGERIPFTVE